jgi:ribA/ribD-fused uncharacterized protein
MESLLSKPLQTDLENMVLVGLGDPRAELELKVLPGQIQTKDVADRIVRAIETVTTGGYTEEHRASFNFPDDLRVHVFGPETIHKVCTTTSFKGLPVEVERKQRYYRAGGGVDVLDLPDLRLRATLRKEEPVRKDFSGSPMDPNSYVRILHRKSWKTADGLLRIDMSMVKSKTNANKTFPEILRQPPSYELEVEVLAKEKDKIKEVMKSLYRHVEALLAAYQESPFLLTEADRQRYDLEFNGMKLTFLNPVTMERRHVVADRPNNILTGYTVTNKADGERSFLVVMRDKRLLRVTPSGKITWTGVSATKDTHVGDVVDGEFLADRNLFCIFDVYAFRGKKTTSLPLMTTEDDTIKNPLKSRLGCARQFVADLKTDFVTLPSGMPMRIENKLFLAGDHAAMEEAIRRILDTKFEYPTDGLIFTPRASPAGPMTERKGNTWLTVYKWKPASQNSIDFLVRIQPGPVYDSVLKKQVVTGSLYVSRGPFSDIVYPCETLTGEYVPPTLPADLQRIGEVSNRVPAPFQPSAPRAPEAFHIHIPVNERNVPVDSEGRRVEDNTIIECARDTKIGRWILMRTRYDKTYQYRVLGKPNFGNDQAVADAIWTNMYVPVTEEMIRNCASRPVDDSAEDDLYYRDELEARNRILKDVYGFHNRVKEGLYHSSVKVGDTLLELAVGRAGDLHKWRKAKPSKVVGIDLSASNLTSPRQGACARYLKEREKAASLPPALFIAADMTQPLYEQDNAYLRILAGTEQPSTPYLEKFAGLTEFDAISCQFAIHYACESEEVFRQFVGNLEKHGKGLFFGTCMDGQQVYSLLLGKPAHTFRVDSQIFGEITKQYADGDAWKDEFGMAIDVKLESFERPVREYLVPFEKVSTILAESGYQLVSTNLFSDHYAQQKDYVFGEEQKAFSFLHRSFVFKKGEKTKPVEEVVVPTTTEVKEEPKEKKIKKIKVKETPTEGPPPPEPVFFFVGNPTLDEYKAFSNAYDAPFQVDGVTYPTVEHYYQYQKAKTFGDEDMATKIMKSPSAKTAKTYGKKVKDFKEEEWASKKDEIMKTAVRAKFTQHPDLLKKLVDTYPRPIGEADPRDKYWSIGTGADTSKAKKPDQWPGKNRLGAILMEIRESLKTDSEGEAKEEVPPATE